MVVQEDDDDAEVAIAAGLIGFTAGIAIGAAMDNNYYYGPYGWHGGAYMYNDAWDDYYDHREDAREDWMDHREDLVEERSDRLEDRRGPAEGPRREYPGAAHRSSGEPSGKPARVAGATSSAQRHRRKARAQHAGARRNGAERLDTARNDADASSTPHGKRGGARLQQRDPTSGTQQRAAARTHSRVTRAAHRSARRALGASKAGAACLAFARRRRAAAMTASEGPMTAPIASLESCSGVPCVLLVAPMFSTRAAAQTGPPGVRLA